MLSEDAYSAPRDFEIASSDVGMESLFVAVPGGSTVTVDSPKWTEGEVSDARGICAADVLAVVEERTGIPAAALVLRGTRGLPLVHDAFLPWGAVSFEAVLRGGLAGGKGGFGAMLRALAKQNTGHKTTDFGACRDLNGRRLRHVNNEMKLRQWSELQERKKDLAKQGVEVDSDEEERAMATSSGIKGWHLGVPSWIEHVQERESKSSRRKV